MKLHILPPSPNSHGCIAVINSLGLKDIEIINAYGKTRTEEFLAINPCHTCKFFLALKVMSEKERNIEKIVF